MATNPIFGVVSVGETRPRSASYPHPGHDVHQAWITKGRWGTGMTFGEHTRRDRLGVTLRAFRAIGLTLAFVLFYLNLGPFGPFGPLQDRKG